MVDPVTTSTPDATGAGSIYTPNLYDIAPVQTEQEQLLSNKVQQTTTDMAGDPLWQLNRLKDKSQVGAWQNFKDGFGDTAIASTIDLIKDEGVIGGAENIGHKAGTWLGDLVGLDFGESNFDKQAHAKELLKDVPLAYWDSIMQYDDLGAAQRARARIMADVTRTSRMGLQRGGVSQVAMLAGGLVDADLPLMIATDGAWGSVKLARAGYKASRAVGLGRAVSGRVAGALDGAVLGAESMAIIGGVKLATDDTASVEQAIHGVINGAMFGGAFGGVLGSANANNVMRDVAHNNAFNSRMDQLAGTRQAVADIQVMHMRNSVTRPITEVDTNMHGRDTEGGYTKPMTVELPEYDGKSNSASNSSGEGMENAVTMISGKDNANFFSTEQALEQQAKMRLVSTPVSVFDRTVMRALGFGERNINADIISAHSLRNIIAIVEHSSWQDLEKIGGPRGAKNYLKDAYKRLEDMGFGDEILPIQSKQSAMRDLETLFEGKDPVELKAAQDLIKMLSQSKAPTIGKLDREGGVYYHGTGLDTNALWDHQDGVSNKANSVSVGQPFLSPSVSTFFHEVAHWAYSNMLTPRDRLEFWDTIEKDFTNTGRKPNDNVARHLPDMGVKSNSGHGPQELFANQFDVHITRKMSKTHTELAQKSFWDTVVGRMKHMFDFYMKSTPVNRNLQKLFDKIAPTGGAPDKLLPPKPKLSLYKHPATMPIADRARKLDESYQGPGPAAAGRSTYLPEEQAVAAHSANWMQSTGAKAMLTNLASTPFGKLMTGNWTMATGKAGKLLNASHNVMTRFANAVGNDTMRMATSASPTANWFFLNVFESPSSFGRGVVSATAAAYAATQERVIGSSIIRWNAVAWQWAKANNKTMSMFNRSTGIGLSREGARSLYREIRLNMNDISLGRAPRSGSDPHIAQLIEMAQKHADLSLKWLKGDDPNYSVLGMENVVAKPGYLPQLLDGTPMNDALVSGAVTHDAMVEAFTEGYVRNGLPREIAEKVAGANVSRALNRAIDVDTSMIDLLNEDGRTFLRERLINENKLPLNEVDAIMQHLTGMAEERGKAGFAKHRNDLDMDIDVVTTDGSSLKLVDFMNNNIPEVLARYRKGVAGAGALARKGIRSRKELDTFISTIQKEMRDAGEEAIPADHMKAMVSDFFSGPRLGFANGAVNKGIDPTISIAKRIANLSLLSNLGITQMIDSANSMAVDGFMSWARHTKAMVGLDKQLRDVNNSLLDDLSVLAGDIGHDQHIFMEHASLDEIGKGDSWAWVHGLRNVVHDLSFVQQYSSMFNAVRTHQQKVAAAIVSNKVIKAIRNGTDTARLTSDFGMSPALQKHIKGLIDNGTIEFATVGGREFVNRLHADRWSTAAANDFGAIMMRAQDSLVMRNMIGESDAWMHTNAGAVLTHLKMFPITAVTKQMVRQGRFMDAQTMGTALYGVALAYTVLKVQDVLMNRTVDERDQAMRAIGYSSMLGWIPMAVDPTMTMLGLDDYRMQRYGKSYETTIPTVEVANKLMKASGAVATMLTGGDLSKSQESAMLAIPFVKTLGIGTWFMDGTESTRPVKQTPDNTGVSQENLDALIKGGFITGFKPQN